MKATNTMPLAVSAKPVDRAVGDHPTARRGKEGRRPNPYPRGSIGADFFKRHYVNYLVERYHRSREVEIASGRIQGFRYGALFKNIETKFKAPTYFIPDVRFAELVDYLHSRIDNTFFGRRKKSRGISNFESFDEYKMRYV